VPLIFTAQQPAAEPGVGRYQQATSAIVNNLHTKEEI
jgi:hypothetical protein